MNVAKAQSLMVMAGVGVALGIVAYVAIRGFKGAARDAVTGAAGAVGDAAAGTVEGIGEILGIPQTSESACCAAIRAGDKWQASFDCPAGDFLKWITTGEKPAGCPGGASGSW